MDELQKYLEDKIALFGGNLHDAAGGALNVKPTKRIRTTRVHGILEVLYEVYRISNEERV